MLLRSACASWRSIMSDFQPCSCNSVEAMARKPWPEISSFVYPKRRSAARIVFSLMGRSVVLMLGKTYLPWPVKGLISFNSATACFERGTIWGDFIFIFSAGIRHSALLRSISDHSAYLSSPGLINTSGARFKAHLATGVYTYPSMARSSSPIFLGSVIVAMRPCLTGAMAPRRSADGSRSARPVDMA